VSVSVAKALNDKTWMLLGPRYSRMGAGTTCMASTLKGQAFVNKECGKRGGDLMATPDGHSWEWLHVLHRQKPPGETA
jgi:hypothetical protein